MKGLDGRVDIAVGSSGLRPHNVESRMGVWYAGYEWYKMYFRPTVRGRITSAVTTLSKPDYPRLFYCFRVDSPVWPRPLGESLLRSIHRTDFSCS